MGNQNITNHDSENSHENIANEYTPLLNHTEPLPGERGKKAVSEASSLTAAEQDVESGSCLSDSGGKIESERTSNVAGVILILLLGVFIANADGSLVLATSGTISSEFNDLNNAGWLVSSYTLAMCATQSLYGKLSDIYGRKSTIIVSYVFFAVGCAICGLGLSLQQVILGRLLAGVGGAGINCLVSIVIADMVPIREVATWRSYVNIAATTGRSLGGPIGGYLTDTVGWRWSFLGQCPPTLFALVLVCYRLKVTTEDEEEHDKKCDQLTKLRRIDFLGAMFLSTSITCGILVLEFGGQRMAWMHPMVLSLFGAFLGTGTLFLLTEAFWAKEPIFPLRLLLNRDVLTSYIGLGFQSGGQMAMMLLVPMYFQVSAHASVTTAGAHLMPSVMGNAVGGLLTGYIIRRTGRYKILSILAGASGTLSYALMLLRWHGNTSFFESLYIIPGGFGNGIILSTSFIGLTAGLEAGQIAIGSSGLYLSANIGMVGGLSIAVAVLQNSLRRQLRISLEGIDHRETIIEKALSDIEYVRSLQGKLGEVVAAAYIKCLAYTHGVSLVGAIIALAAAFCIREHRL